MKKASKASEKTAPPPVKRVWIVGGTHGNEANGVQLAKHLQRHPELYAHHSFEVNVLLSNVASIAKNSRYVEEDMNRCFYAKDLSDDSLVSLESKRAKEINAIVGPKGDSPAADLIIDLHNTTADTGHALLFSPRDELSAAIAARLMSIDSSVRVCHWNPNATDYPMLPSVGRHGMTFEVGAVAWGCVDAALYQQSLGLLLSALEYIDAHNACCKSGKWSNHEIDAFSLVRAVDYPRDESGELAAMIHPKLQGRDFEPIQRGDPVFLSHDGKTAIPWIPKRSADQANASVAEEDEQLCKRPRRTSSSARC
jgi:succinylglutamate desuccinylase